MNSSLLRSVMVLTIAAVFAMPAHANRLDESVRLGAIVRELATVKSLARVNANAVADHEVRLRFDYAYMLNALSYLESSASEHLNQRSMETTERWNLNSGEIVSNRRSILGVSQATPDYVPKLTEQEGLGAIASDIELVRALVETSAELSKSELGRVHFDYAYMIEVLSYLEYSARAHLSLQNSQPRTQWDKERLKGFNSNGQ